ncbi:MAG TPA: DUF2220 family protein [Burkholderiaceae bacterium]|nr:DUF2220 family protein [Burkholderiaceae bacterium]
MTGPALPPRHPFLLRLAALLLAKAERSRAAGPIRLPLDAKAAPELHGAADVEQLQLLRLQLDELVASGWVALQLEPPRAFAAFTDRRPRLELRDFDALAAWCGHVPLAQRWQRQWRDHLAAQWAAQPRTAPPDPAALLDYLARSPMTPLEGLPLEDATRSLLALGELCRSGRPWVLREASARVFAGRSKLLDHREELLRLLGAAPGQFAEAPIQLLLAPPAPAAAASGTSASFDEVLFIENLATFEHMADVRRSAWRRSLLVYAAGFRGSARRLLTRSGCRLYLRAPAPADALAAVEAWLFDAAGHDCPVAFFGDLDWAGLRILASLREVFPAALAWRPGYEALAARLQQGGGHAPEQAGKALQTDPGATGCPWADGELLPLLRRTGRFVDQEVFDPAAAGA